MAYVYSEILLSHIKKKKVVICGNMDGPREYYVSKTNIDSTSMWNLKSNTNKIISKHKHTHWYRKKTYLSKQIDGAGTN